MLQDLLIYCKELQSQYGDENQILKQELRNTKLDLEHATASRREMQQVLQELDYDNNYIKVERGTACCEAACPFAFGVAEPRRTAILTS